MWASWPLLWYEEVVGTAWHQTKKYGSVGRRETFLEMGGNPWTPVVDVLFRGWVNWEVGWVNEQREEKNKGNNLVDDLVKATLFVV